MLSIFQLLNIQKYNTSKYIRKKYVGETTKNGKNSLKFYHLYLLISIDSFCLEKRNLKLWSFFFEVIYL